MQEITIKKIDYLIKFNENYYFVHEFVSPYPNDCSSYNLFPGNNCHKYIFILFYFVEQMDKK